MTILAIIADAIKRVFGKPAGVTVVRGKGDDEGPLASHWKTDSTCLPSGYMAAGVKLMREMGTESTR